MDIRAGRGRRRRSPDPLGPRRGRGARAAFRSAASCRCSCSASSPAGAGPIWPSCGASPGARWPPRSSGSRRRRGARHGGREKEIQVRVDAVALESHRLTLADLGVASARANVDINAGTLEQGEPRLPRARRRALPAAGGRRGRGAALRAGRGRRRAVAVRVADVAEVTVADREIRHLVRVDGQRGRRPVGLQGGRRQHGHGVARRARRRSPALAGRPPGNRACARSPTRRRSSRTRCRTSRARRSSASCSRSSSWSCSCAPSGRRHRRRRGAGVAAGDAVPDALRRPEPECHDARRPRARRRHARRQRDRRRREHLPEARGRRAAARGRRRRHRRGGGRRRREHARHCACSCRWSSSRAWPRAW